MKNLSCTLSLIFLVIVLEASLSSYSVKEDSKKVLGIEFTIKNDTNDNVRLYDGKGYFTINRGTVKKVEVEQGRKYYNGEGGKKGKMLFEVSPDMSGKTIKLSAYF